jgi:hypothetical protein
VKAASSTTAVEKLDSVSVRRLVVTACVLNLLAIALMIWSVLDPTPLPVMVVMSLGQVIGTCGLLCYLAAVLVYQWKRKKPSAPAK